MEERPQEETPGSWHRRYPGLIVAGFSVVLSLLVLAFALYGLPLVLGLLGGGCPSGQRAVLHEVDHYEPHWTGPYAAEASCNARYTTQGSREDVLGYYDERLRENGWEVGGYWAANPPQGIEVFGEQLSDLAQAPEEGVRSGLEARRGDYSYSVEYYPPGSPAARAEAGGSEDEAMVVVSATDEPGAGGKVGKGGSPKK